MRNPPAPPEGFAIRFSQPREDPGTGNPATDHNEVKLFAEYF